MKKITLGPTLVVLVGPSGAGKSTYAKQFPINEIVSTDGLREFFTGDHPRQDMDDTVREEFDRRILTRLEAGLRVVADATHIRDSDRRRTARLAAKVGAKLIYLVIDRPLESKLKTAGWRTNVRIDGKELVISHDETFHANLPKILNGDGLDALVIDTRKFVPDIIFPLARDTHACRDIEQAPLYDIQSRGYTGILVVGDVHGNVDGLMKMIAYARANKYFLLFLGDIVDYDPGTLTAADIVADLIFQGEAASIFGNHERKIFRWVTQERRDGFTGNLSSGNDVTVNQLKAMLPGERLRWETRFLGMCAQMPHTIRVPRYFFTHGAANPEMLTTDQFRFAPRSTEESLAVFGETTGELINGFPRRIYPWVENIPPRQTVVVGHDCRKQTHPLIVTGAAGGRAIFLDTGSSKPDRFPEGRLSGMILDIEDKKKIGFVLENERFIDEKSL
jgi:protein phosphatase